MTRLLRSIVSHRLRLGGRVAQLGLLLATTLLMSCSSDSGPASDSDSIDAESFAVTGQALTTTSLLGFENVSAWSMSSGQLQSSVDRVEGNVALALSGVGYAEVTSAPVSALSNPTAVSVQVKLPSPPSNPWWYGSVGLRITSPSRRIYEANVGQKELSGLPLGSYQALTFDLSPALAQSLSVGNGEDIVFKWVINVPYNGAPLLLDDFSLGDDDGGTCQFAAGLGNNPKVVRVAYLVPSDKVPRADHQLAIENAAKHLQVWWKQQMGETFTLSNDSVVETILSSHSSEWFRTNPQGSDPWLDYWLNTLADIQSEVGFAPTSGERDETWLVYIDADVACVPHNGRDEPQITGAIEGIAVLSANDVRGVVGEAAINPCTGAQDWPSSSECRWVGGLGHELGHALGLPHPPGCDAGQATCDSGALMWVGYAVYPDTYLRDAEIEQLQTSPFIAPEPGVADASCSCQPLL